MAKKNYLILIFWVSCIALYAQPGFFSSKLPPQILEEAIVPAGSFHPLPKAGDKQWKQLPAGIKNAYISEAEKNLGKPWEVTAASEFMEYRRSGNRMKQEFKLFDQRSRLEFAVIAELIEDKGRFIDEIINGIWKICEESWWGVPAHSKTILPDVSETPFIDLFDSETAQMLSWVYYLMEERLDKESPIISKRLAGEIKKRILDPALDNNYWWKTGKNNWTTWISSNWLASVLLVEKDRERQIEAIRQILSSLDIFYGSYAADGGCDEGPSYWNRAAASLFESLDLLRMASGGKIDYSSDAKIKAMGAYYWKMHIADYYFVNFADARPIIVPNASAVYRYGKYIKDNNLVRLARFIAEKQHYNETVLPNENFIKYNDRPFLYGFGRQLLLLNQMEDLLNGENDPPLVKSAWLSNLQVFTARQKAHSTEGFYFAAKGGHNAESHNHNDVGTFTLYADEEPLLIDLGVEQYTKETFGKNRYQLWTMRSDFHNLPTINGIQQKDGKEFAAREVKAESGKSHSAFILDIAGAYPEEAAVQSWKRSIRLDDKKGFTVTEDFRLKEVKDTTFLSLMVYGTVELDQQGNLFLQSFNGKRYRVVYDKKVLTAVKEFYPVTDDWLKESWVHGANRIKLIFKFPELKGKTSYSILKINH